MNKTQLKNNEQANEYLQKAVLADHEKQFVLEHWIPPNTLNAKRQSAFFTPVDLAIAFALYVPDFDGVPSIVDLCAGIGSLSYWLYMQSKFDKPIKLTAIEIDPLFVEVGKKIVPEATWIRADVFDKTLWPNSGEKFTYAISNPPFGHVSRNATSDWLDYQGSFDLMVAEIAHRYTRYGATMILPSQSVAFRSDTPRSYIPTSSKEYDRFLAYHPDAQILPSTYDTSLHKKEWIGASPSVEIGILQNDN
jgi:predicted RNA methylase